jgi:hypothetical protein
MTALSVPSPTVKQSKKNAGNMWKLVEKEPNTCPHSMCEDLSAHRKAHFGRPAVICQTTYSRFTKILAKHVKLLACGPRITPNSSSL